MTLLPKVTHLLQSLGRELKTVTFVKPATGKELALLNVADSRDSPPAVVLGIRRMRLVSDSVIPYHVHRKEKLYISQSDGILRVTMHRNFARTDYLLTKAEQRLVIPPNTPHAVICEADFMGLVITSTQEAADIEWETDAEELFLNRHRGQESKITQ
jgi:quercetin dioxygenase-like cupin family protein